MKVLALNSSPRTGGLSKTEMMLTHLVDGMQAAGAEVETINLREKTIRLCSGCFTCWTKTPGLCIHKDDMTGELFPKWLAADVVIYASPLYHYTLNALMKKFIERTLPILLPFFGEADDRTHHPLRAKHPKAVFLSVAGFPEMAVFDLLSTWVRGSYGRAGTVVAEIYRPSAEAMTSAILREKARDILDATAQAGREIVGSMAVRPETLARIQQELVDDHDLWRRMANLYWKSCIAEGVTPREFEEKGMIPRPDSIEIFLLFLAMGFNAEAAGSLRGVMQFDFTGEVAGSCHLKFADGKIDTGLGAAERPDILIRTPFEVWMDILTGKADGQKLFMEQKYTVEGDLSLLLRMKELFGR
jgi:multimeric flavodoxin WrbA